MLVIVDCVCTSVNKRFLVISQSVVDNLSYQNNILRIFYTREALKIVDTHRRIYHILRQSSVSVCFESFAWKQSAAFYLSAKLELL